MIDYDEFKKLSEYIHSEMERNGADVMDYYMLTTMTLTMGLFGLHVMGAGKKEIMEAVDCWTEDAKEFVRNNWDTLKNNCVIQAN